MGQTEEALIRRIQQIFPTVRDGLGIGDDAALFASEGDSVITTDMLVEGVDFTTAIPAGFIGTKAVAVNVSDLAAMGAVPERFLLTVAAPSATTDNLDPLLYGVQAAASA